MKWMLGMGLAAGMALATAAGGAMLERGTHELYFSGSGHPGGAMSASARYGRFVAHGLEIGASAGAGITGRSSWMSSGLFAEHSFDLGSAFVPFVGTSFQYRTTRVEARPVNGAAGETGTDGDRQSEPEMRRTQGFLAGASAGMKYFVAQNAALSGAVHVDVPSDSSLHFNTDPDNVHVSFVVATRFFF